VLSRQQLHSRILGASALAAATLALSGPLAAQTHYSEGEFLRMLGFGSDVAVAGERVCVGEAGRIMGPGAVYLYERSEGGWIETRQITALDGTVNDGFGSLVAADEGSLVVTAPNAGQGQGLVYLYDRDEETGEFVERGVFGPDVGGSGGYGSALAVSDDLVAIGWPGFGEVSGRVDLIRRTEDGWDLFRTLTSPDSVRQSAFGAAVALHGNRLVVASPLVDGLRGVVHEYRVGDGEVEYREAIRPDSLPEGAVFGAAMALRDGRLAVGAPNQGLADGRVHLFERDPLEGGWEHSAELSAPGEPGREGFGTTFGMGEGTLWVGAPGANQARGAVYLFGTSASGEWTEAEVLTMDGTRSGDAFGVALSADPENPLAAVAAIGVDNQAGSVFLYERTDEGWQALTEIASEPERLPESYMEPGECSGGAVSGFDCSAVDMVAFLPVSEMGGGRGIQVNDMWGWTDPESGRNYAIVGRTDGTSFVDVSDPSNPVYLGNLPRTEGTPVASWRDMKVYGHHVYIVADGSPGHGVQIFDLHRLRDHQGEPVLYDPVLYDEDARYEGVSAVHNIFINEDTGYAYVVGANGGGETCGGGLHMLDLKADPLAPEFVGCFADQMTGRQGTGYSHDVQCVVYSGPDDDYAGREICFGANETALSIADVTDKASPVAVSRASYPAVAYAHQGWLTEDQRYFFLGDELDEQNSEDGHTRTLVWDVSDLDDPLLVTEHHSSAVATDHNLYIRGDVMYQSNYESGLRIVDVSDPENPEWPSSTPCPTGRTTPG